MDLKIAEENNKSSPRREFRSSRSSGRNQKSILEAIAQFTGGEKAAAEEEDGRMKIVVRREDLKQVLEAIRDGRRRGAAVELEQRLNLLRRRQILRAARGGRRGSWMPNLQTIPEEL